MDEPTAALHTLTGWALERGEPLDGLAVNRPTLEDVYLSLTGGGEDRGAGDGAAPTDGPAAAGTGTTPRPVRAPEVS